MENLSNRFVLRTKFLITFSQKWFKDTRKKVVEVQLDNVPVISYEEKDKTGNERTPDRIAQPVGK